MLDLPVSARGIFCLMSVVRLAISTDIEQILAIDPSVQGQSRRAFMRAFIESAVDHGECFVAENNGVLFGYGVMNYGFLDRGFVHLIYVDTAHQRGRVASRLFDEF
jgi:hypothetical protein